MRGATVMLLLAAPNRMFAVAVMAGMFAFEVGQSGVFTFVDRIGIQAGLDTGERGSILGATSFIGMAGGCVCGVAGYTLRTCLAGQRWIGA